MAELQAEEEEELLDEELDKLSLDEQDLFLEEDTMKITDSDDNLELEDDTPKTKCVHFIYFCSSYLKFGKLF